MTQVIFFLGRPGSGKGTQINYLEKATGFEVIRTGELLRKKAEEQDFLGEKIAEALSKGALIPTPLVFLIWMPMLVAYRERGIKGIIFDGNPRKLYEAKMLEEIFEMFGWCEITALHLCISPQEARDRMLQRGRSDDNEDDIATRLSWFNDEVMPVIENYKKEGILVEINGEQGAEDAWEEIQRKLNISS